MKNFLLLLVVILLAGCAVETPEKKEFPIIDPVRQASQAEQRKRAANFRKITSSLRIRGALINDFAVGLMDPEVGIKMIEDLGFNMLVVDMTGDKYLNKNLAKLIVYVKKRNMKVCFRVSPVTFHHRYAGAVPLRYLRPNSPDIVEIVDKIADFNADLPEDARIDGIIVTTDIYYFNDNRAEYIPGQIYRWSENTYGIGNENDLMLKKYVEILRTLPKHARGIVVVTEITDFYHEKAENKELSFGKTEDFLQLSSPPNLVVLKAAGSKPTEIYKSCQREMASMRGKGNALILVKLAEHTSFAAGDLRRRDWNDFVRCLDYVIKKNRGPVLEGIITGPFAIVEFMHREME